MAEEAVVLNNTSGKEWALLPPPVGRRHPQLPLPSTDFAGPYQSTFALHVAETTPELLRLLKHANCSYLSSKAKPPTLLQLKQHAQSLAVLIKHMTVSTLPAAIDNQNVPIEGLEDFHEKQSYDWLSNLQRPYTNEDRHHQMPLTSLLNTIDPAPIDGEAYTHICPLHSIDISAPANAVSLPYATHQSLIEHANEALELLDHEYSAKGGLLAILPTTEQEEDRQKASTTLLGQLILFITRLVQRIHDLEREYANALDIIKGEVTVPLQVMSRLGPHGRMPREMVYPQDRYVLVNAGDDIWQYLDSEFEKKEAEDGQQDWSSRADGVSGELLWDITGNPRGITALDITTRYYRLRNDPLKTVFVIPAHQEHPGTKVTREMERQPTVFSVVKPVWPERASTIEMKHREDLKELKRLRHDHATLQIEVEDLKASLDGVFYERELKAQSLRELKKKGDEELQAAEAENQKLITLLRGSASEANLIAEGQFTEALNAKAEITANQQLHADLVSAAKQEREKAEAITRKTQDVKTREDARLHSARVELQERRRELDDMEQEIEERDAAVAKAAELAHQKLMAVWKEQIVDQQILIEFLQRHKAQVLKGEFEPSEEDKKRGTATASKLFDNADITPGSWDKWIKKEK